MSLRRDLYLLLLSYSDKKDHLTVEDFTQFLKIEQKVRCKTKMINTPNHNKMSPFAFCILLLLSWKHLSKKQLSNTWTLENIDIYTSEQWVQKMFYESELHRFHFFYFEHYFIFYIFCRPLRNSKVSQLISTHFQNAKILFEAGSLKNSIISYSRNNLAAGTHFLPSDVYVDKSLLFVCL